MVGSYDEGEKEEVLNYDLKGGRIMANPLPGEEIVISGIAGVFPNSMNIHEFRDNLFNKVNMVLPNKRWDFEHPEMPTCSGTIPEINKYDSGFFGVHERQSHSLDTLTRILHEKTVEAIFDAGMNLSDFENTNTGVFVGACFSENDKAWFFDYLDHQSYAMTGSERSMIAHRLSYFLKLKGPSYAADTACSSSLFALEHAYRAMRLGEIDSAIIGGTNLCLHPFMTMQFLRLGVLSHDGSCKCFDAQGNGYARSEAITCIILQKAKFAKRMYANLVHVRSNCDGYKEQGITFPSGPAQIDLLTKFYDECGVDRYSLSYLEAHGTGTLVGDPEECFAIDNVFAKERKTPLLIGSVKSNIGHSEPASGLCSIIKAIIGMETGFIPPNINFTTPRKEIKGIIEGRMKVVVDKTPFEDNRGLIGINSFGFGGGNCHVLLKWNTKEKINNGLPEDDIPRLVCVSGRTPNAVQTLLGCVSQNQLDAEFVGLLHEVFRNNVQNHLYRGYAIVSKLGELSTSFKFSPICSRPLFFAFGELHNWYDIGNQLLVLPVFSNSIQRINKYLVRKGIDIYKVLLNRTPDELNTPIVGSITVQIGVIEILNLLEMKPKACLGSSTGELVSAYYNGILSLEETMNCAVIVNEAAANNNNTAKSIHEESGTIPEKVNTSNYFKEYLDSATLKEQLVQNISNVLTYKENFSGKSKWANNFVNTIIQTTFNGIETVNLDSSVILKIGSGLVNSEDFPIVSIFDKKNENYVVALMNGIGRLYELGYNPQISRIYPSVDFPVSRGTKMISPYVKWIHKKERFVPQFSLELIRQAQHGVRHYRILAIDHQWAHVTGHIIDGRNLFPATGYLYIVWDTFSLVSGIPFDDIEVVFENCKFIRANTVPKKGDIVLQVAIHLGTGNFEVVEGDSTVVTGRVSVLADNERSSFISESEQSYLHTGGNSGLSMKPKDIYKELRLRGYNYKGAFRGIQESNANATKGLIKWEDNWVTFIDNMLQMKILQLDSRLLYVPIFISKLVILTKPHLDMINTHFTVPGKSPILPVYCDKTSGIIRSGGVTISGLIAKSIARRKDLGIPVLEKYVFVPNITELDIHESIRVNIQIILENSLMYQVKAIELIDEFTIKRDLPLTPIIKLALEDQPLIQPFVKIFSKFPIDAAVDVEDKKLGTETNCLLVIVSNISKRKDILNEAFVALKEDGFIISRESLDFDASEFENSEIAILTVHKTSTETLLLLRKQVKTKEPNYINVTAPNSFSWINQVQDVIKKKQDVILYAENDHLCGILGLVNCLRKEPETKHIKCVFLMDNNEKFEPAHPWYINQLGKNMAVNVYKNGHWGTYRHLLLNKQNSIEAEHCFVNVTVRGDLSSLRWIEGPLCYNMKVPSEQTLIHVYYAALNFRDVMTATGKINADVITQDRLQQECVQGFEFSGRDSTGRRIMGMLVSGALSSLVLADSYLAFNIPDSWSLEDAATVPIVYGTLVYGLVIRGEIKKGQSILIHSGTGGIGQAAIRLSIHYGCTVYTTVGTQMKREFIKETFPELKDNHIGNSHDETFEQLIYKETNGKGVDIVLNSLAEDKLLASVRCLAKGGRLLEIGKYDMANNNHVNLLLFQKEASFHGVMMDQIFTEVPDTKTKVTEIFLEALNKGVIKPLSRNIFKYNEIEQAFRFMATGKHMGKVLIKIREPEDQPIVVPSVQKFPGIARYFCDPEKAYVIIGGLGGFGLELADWLVLRGAKKIVLSSRKGITTGYQDMKIRIWKSYGTLVKVSAACTTTKNGCKQLIDESLQLGRIDAIFNLAVVLDDSLFENQTPESFARSFEPKAIATTYLDELTRIMCPDLSEFVVFSSVSCGRGNAGQSNYGMSNSVMERVCEKRRHDGFPALAIEWGAVGDVGLVAEMLEEETEIEISGTLQQKISNCLQVMDTLLKQKDSAIVSSMVVAEKRGVNAADNIVDAVINILGLNDVKSISLHSTLAELGLDSMTGVEIKQVLEREFEVYLTAKDIRTMTLARLKEIQEEKYGISQNVDSTEEKFGLEMVFRLVSDEFVSSLPYLQLKSKVDDESNVPKVLLFPGIEGFAKVYEVLATKICAHAVALQFPYDNKTLTIAEMAQSLIPVVEEHLSETKSFIIVSYSYGTLIALEVIHILESQGYRGTIISLDGAPLLMQRMLLHFDIVSEQYFQTALVCHLLSFYVSAELVSENKEAMFLCSSWEERLNLGVELAKDSLTHDVSYLKTISNGIYWRLKSLMDYRPSYNKLESEIKLYKPKHISIQGLEEDYELSKIFVKPVVVKVFEGNHVTFLDEQTLADEINADIQKIIDS